ncbi:MAG: hypothetical protein CMN41_03100 [SAR116 cluster bacterium]|nr:hypothetical protein [SAR116 cluster bacterium]
MPGCGDGYFSKRLQPPLAIFGQFPGFQASAMSSQHGSITNPGAVNCTLTASYQVASQVFPVAIRHRPCQAGANGWIRGIVSVASFHAVWSDGPVKFRTV